MALLEVTGLRAGYGELEILQGVDLSVEEGEHVTIIGPNGAGKSTLMRTIFGMTERTEGRVTFRGEDLTDEETVDIVERGLALVPQENNIFPDLTVLENLRMGAYTREELPDEALDRVFDRFPVLEERLEQEAGELSGGQQQMVAIGRALVIDPDLLALDEPSSGLAPHLVQDLFEEIDAINDSGTTILSVEQNAEEILQRADRGYILTQGQIRREDTAETLLADEDIQDEFFGG